MSENEDDTFVFAGILPFFVALFLLALFFYFAEVTWHPKFPFCLG